jgi:hypothetical protein
MSKSCECGHCKHDRKDEKGCLSKAPGFYMAVCDVVEQICKIGGESCETETFRYFNEKFVDSPEKALLFAFDTTNERWKIDPKEILEGVTYDPENNEYIRKTILTRDGHTPTEKQMKKILDGTYEYILLTEYVQVFETNLVGNKSMISRSITQWRERTGKTY